MDILSNNTYLKQWHLHNRASHEFLDNRSSINCEKAWGEINCFGKKEIVIAVLDDGCSLTNKTLSGKSKFYDWAYIENNKLIRSSSKNSSPQKMFKKNHNHGTSICSLVAGGISKSLPIGVAPACRLFPIRWEWDKDKKRYNINENIFFNIMKEIECEVDIVLNTWTKSPFFEFKNETLELISSYSQNKGRRNKGITFLWSAGNNNCPINFSSAQEIPYRGGVYGKSNHKKWFKLLKSTQFRNNLTKLENVITVGAITSLVKRAHYSAYGKGLSCTAPSNNSHAYGLYESPELGLTTSFGDNDQITNNFKGTSGAAALVAGVIALMFSENLNLTAARAKRILEETASKDLCFDSGIIYKMGSVIYEPSEIIPPMVYSSGEFDDDNWSPWFGYGKVDALKAVRGASCEVMEL